MCPLTIRGASLIWRVEPPSRTVAHQLEAFKKAWCYVGRPTTTERATYGVMCVDQSATTGVELVARTREADQCTPHSHPSNIRSLYCLLTCVTISVKIVIYRRVYITLYRYTDSRHLLRCNRSDEMNPMQQTLHEYIFVNPCNIPHNCTRGERVIENTKH